MTHPFDETEAEMRASEQGIVEAAQHVGLHPTSCTQCRALVMLFDSHTCNPGDRVVTLEDVVEAFHKAGGET